MSSWIVLASVLLCSASPALAKRSKCDIVLKHIDAVLAIYDKEHPLKHYPSTLKELQNFAAKKGQLLDLSVFSRFSYDRRGTRLFISHQCKGEKEGTVELRDSIIVY